MKKYLKVNFLVILFCIMFSSFVFGDTEGYMDPEKYYLKSEIGSASIYDSVGWVFKETEPGLKSFNDNDIETWTHGKNTGQLTTYLNDIKKDYSNKILECIENNYSGLDFLTQFDINYKYQKVETVWDEEGDNIIGYNLSADNSESLTVDLLHITDTLKDILYHKRQGISDYVEITFEVNIPNKGVEKITIKTHTRSNYFFSDGDGDKYSGFTETEPKEGVWPPNMYANTINFFEALVENAIEGLVAGSIGGGFNVGTPYSDKQVSLSSAMELVGNYYDFKAMNNIKFVFEYYYSPIFGKMYASEEPKIPRTKEEWVKLATDRGDKLIKGSSVILDDKFLDYASTLSEDMVNKNGEKIASNIQIQGGATKSDLANSKNPRSVISYNVEMVVPYMFEIVNGRGKLVKENLRPIDGYKYCLTNDGIYTTNNNEIDFDSGKVTNMINAMNNDGTYRDNIYLFYRDVQVSDTESVPKGIIIVGTYNEVVVDTSLKPGEEKNERLGYMAQDGKRENNLYLTGRRIGFANGYSDNLNLKNANSQLMYVSSDSGRMGYLPLNVAFPVPGVDLKGYSLYNAWHGDLVDSFPELTEKVKEIMVPMNDSEMLNYINNVDNTTEVSNVHGAIPDTAKIIRFFIGFGNIKTGNNIKNKLIPEDYSGKWCFYIVRNNNYIKDESLIEWLKTNEAKSNTFVDSDYLIAKITGDFTNSLGKLTYADWKKMQDIKNELNNDKEMWLVRIINITSMVLGIVLIIFAILFIMAYWVDIFNTFSDFSILQFISFGNLFSVSDKETGGYIENIKGLQTKYVDFKDVLIISCIMIAIGLLFLNVSVLIKFIINIFNYIMFVFGGA